MAFVFPVIGATEWSGGSYMNESHRGRTHHAIDIYAGRGQSIVAPIAGKVIGKGSSNIGGNWIQIEGSDGNTYYFAHMQHPTGLEKGSQVKGGMAIGQVGNSGSARNTKPHVHFSVKRNGVAVNPIKMLQNAILVPSANMDPDLADKTGRTVDWEQVAGGGQSYEGDMDPYDINSAYYETPSTVQQVAEYRRRQAAGELEENPLKVRAENAMRGTLRGMASMVRSHGFDTGSGTETGIAEIERREVG